METKQHVTKKQWVNEEIKKKKYLETNDNENTTIQNLSDEAKAVLREMFIVIQSFLKKKTKTKTRKHSKKTLIYHIKELEKEEQIKPKVSRREEIIKIREEISKIEIKKITIEKKVNKIKSWFSERAISKSDKPLARKTRESK